MFFALTGMCGEAEAVAGTGSAAGAYAGIDAGTGSGFGAYAGAGAELRIGTD